MAIVIVEKGRPVLVKGYGVKRLGSDDPVAPSTIFPMGSTGKAVTVAAFSTLVDQGRIGWDGKVINHLPGFRMWDPWVLQELGGLEVGIDGAPLCACVDEASGALC